MKPSVEVCLTPDLIHQYDFTDKTAVIIDIFRATSCIVAGLNAGVESIKPVATIPECEPYKAKGYITAGERGGIKIEGFDIGNSMAEFEKQKGRKIVMTTTNGTQALEKVREKGAASIAIGAFLNLQAVAHYLACQNKDAVLVCSGWRGKYSLEDAMFAGSLIFKLYYENFEIHPDDDAALGCFILYSQGMEQLKLNLSMAGHFKRLTNLGATRDIDYALQQNCVHTVPTLREDGEIRIN